MISEYSGTSTYRSGSRMADKYNFPISFTMALNDNCSLEEKSWVVVVLVYLTTHQLHLGYLASRDGHPVGRYNAP